MFIVADNIQRAKEFAHAGHDSIGQKRKYTGEPYWVHTDAVALAVHNWPVNYIPAHIIAEIVAHLHDLPEDVNKYPYNLLGIRERFGATVAYLVEELTHKYTSEAYPNLNRAERKVLEAWRLGNASAWAQTIKVFDLMDNTKSIVAHDPNFAKVYLREKDHLFKMMTKVEPALMRQAKNQLKREKKKLGIDNW